MRELLNKIFSGSLGLGRFILSGAAFLLGLSLVLLSVQTYFKISSFLSPKQEISDYIILNKEVGLGHTIFGGKAQFTEEDIKDLKSQEFIKDVGRFQTNFFHVELYFQGMKFTDLFLESVPAKFLEEKSPNFRWSENQDFVPLIISEDFINLYNFAFAVGARMPQISKSTVGLIPLRLDISGPGGIKSFNAKVIGFSERINSVLVPTNFLQWANGNIAKKSEEEVSRVIIQIDSKLSGKLETYLKNKNLKVSEDKIIFNRIARVFNIVMTILFIIGTAFIVFSLVITIMNFSLLIAEAKEEIQLLIQLGYKTSHILKHLLLYLFTFIFIVTILSIAVFFISNKFVIEFLTSNGINATNAAATEVWIVLTFFVFISILVSVYSVSRVLRRF
jgi:ABC-type antimicrobial peptide transport system permease subunit